MVGTPGLRSHDSRRWQNEPHLSVSLAYLRDVLFYLANHQIRLYRLSGQLAPYLTHPDMPQFHDQIEECSTELAAMGDMARESGIRLTMHPAFYIQLSSPDPFRVQRSREEIFAAVRILEAMGLGAESVLVIHVGGVFEDKLTSRQRFVEQVLQLPSTVRNRLALENDDRHYGIEDVLWIHRQTSIRVVMDLLHHHCVNPTRLPMLEGLSLALETWPADELPKIHFSTPRTEARLLNRNGERRLQIPRANQHSDFINPFEFIDLLRSTTESGLRSFDIMLEVKGKDLALLRLREQIERYAPELMSIVQ